ncbi:MAG: hypothetical protein KBS95_00075 [Alistipes sp.]|nr:hypothetical protein [Candidatus Alistipes equi]
MRRILVSLSALLLTFYTSYASDKVFPEIQAHRGGAGLYPENTIDAMLNAIRLGITVLEMDVQFSKDGVAVVSHDAYFHYRYSTRPDGTAVEKNDKKHFLYRMNYDDIEKWDVGKRKSEAWPKKKCIPASKPKLEELLEKCENAAKKKGFTLTYSVELKSRAGKYEGKLWPEYRIYVDRTVEIFSQKGLLDRVRLQSFDIRALEYLHEKHPDVQTVYLVKTNKEDSMEEVLSRLSFTPTWFSAQYLDKQIVQKAHLKGMKVIPWGMNSPERFLEILDMGADAMMTNYPNLALKWKKAYLSGKKVK